MSYLGLVPSEYSSGNRTLRGGITKAGSKNARRAPMEGVWSDRINARIGPDHQPRLDGLPKVVCEIAWKAQIWLCRRHRHLGARGKPQTVVTTAIAREMGAFIWAIARHVQPIETA